MSKRFLAIWFPYLITDWMIIRNPELKDIAFAVITQERNRQIIVHVSPLARQQGLHAGMLMADARIILPNLQTFKHNPQTQHKLLNELAQRCIKYSPQVSIDEAQGLFLNTFGCTHLWNDEKHYILDIVNHLKKLGYQAKVCIADTMATAWAVAHYGKDKIIAQNQQTQAILELPPKALRLNEVILQRLNKLGFETISSFINIEPSTLRRRFGDEIVKKLNQATGSQPESFITIDEINPYQQRLPSLEPINTNKGVEIAIENLLEHLCLRLKKEDLGIRSATLKCYRVDGKLQQISIGTNQATINIKHLFRLFELKINQIKPGLGIELFVLEADNVEELTQEQKTIWLEEGESSLSEINELLDFISIRAGKNAIRRYLPQQHHWPENSIKATTDLNLIPENEWPVSKPRPTVLLNQPEPITVTAPIPDYPPMNFIYKGESHRIAKADGPERIEREWWLESGEHRDYYYVEDENGKRYWLFRLGHYSEKSSTKWFIHGFFA